jgi:hypothetical protein
MVERHYDVIKATYMTALINWLSFYVTGHIAPLEIHSSRQLSSLSKATHDNWAHILALQTVILRYGLPYTYYVDSHSIFRFVQGRDSLWRKHELLTDETDPQWKQVLKDISLSFFPDAKIGVIGLNGSGKSSLLRIMAGWTRIRGADHSLPGIYQAGQVYRIPHPLQCGHEGERRGVYPRRNVGHRGSGEAGAGEDAYTMFSRITQ